MKILQVTTGYYPELQFGGPPQKIHDLSRGLQGRGHRVQVVTLHSTRRAAAQAVQDGIPIRYLPWVGQGSWQVPGGWGALGGMVREADVVHGYGLYSLLCPAAAALAWRAGRPFILEPLGMYTPRARNLGAKRVYHRLFTSWMSRRAARVIAASPSEMEELAGLVEPPRLVLRRNGIDLAPFRKLPPAGRFRAAQGIGDGERVILYIGRISPIKNLGQLVQAFSEATLDGTRLVLVGPALEPDYARELAGQIAELGLDERVLLAGPLYGEDKLAALAAADLFVLPSLSESYGNAAAEAVAAEVPVLLTDGCGIAPQIDGRAGLAVPAGVPSLARGLRLMMEDSAVREGVTARRSAVLGELSWHEPLAQTEALYQALLPAARL
jgi:glycosyltransferase involved in cell wall biosynthesis